MPDLRWFDDMDQFGAETDDALEDLEQDLYHVLIEVVGSNLADPNQGLGIEDVLSGPYDTGWKKKIEQALEKDDRVQNATATITQLDAGNYQIEVQIVADEGVLGLTLVVGADGTVQKVS